MSIKPCINIEIKRSFSQLSYIDIVVKITMKFLSVVTLTCIYHINVYIIYIDHK